MGEISKKIGKNLKKLGCSYPPTTPLLTPLIKIWCLSVLILKKYTFNVCFSLSYQKFFSYSLATGTQVGVIEVVRDAKTVYKIQQESSRLAGKKKNIFLPRVCFAILVVTWHLVVFASSIPVLIICISFFRNILSLAVRKYKYILETCTGIFDFCHGKVLTH